jgi:MFS transporter
MNRVIAIVVGFGLILLFFFVPETFWDRTPRPKAITAGAADVRKRLVRLASGLRSHSRDAHALPTLSTFRSHHSHEPARSPIQGGMPESSDVEEEKAISPDNVDSQMSPLASPAKHTVGFLLPENGAKEEVDTTMPEQEVTRPSADEAESVRPFNYTEHWRSEPPKSYIQSLNPFHGRLSHENWFRLAVRPFILFTYPSVLWSALVYALSVGWLIVLSESVSTIYRNRETYNFTSIQVGLVYISPFIGSIFGTAVAGKVSDLIVRWMARKNDGVYEPEFRLVMAIPIALCTTIGLMGFGWSAQEKDNWAVPTVFFGILSFGASLGSTTAITFCVDSYRQYAGEALVTLNFSKSK